MKHLIFLLHADADTVYYSKVAYLGVYFTYWFTHCVHYSSQACIPYLKKGKNPHILNLSPPLNLNPVWFKDHVGKFD